MRRSVLARALTAVAIAALMLLLCAARPGGLVAQDGGAESPVLTPRSHLGAFAWLGADSNREGGFGLGLELERDVRAGLAAWVQAGLGRGGPGNAACAIPGGSCTIDDGAPGLALAGGVSLFPRGRPPAIVPFLGLGVGTVGGVTDGDVGILGRAGLDLRGSGPLGGRVELRAGMGLGWGVAVGLVL